jgi:hypothetical protein
MFIVHVLDRVLGINASNITPLSTSKVIILPTFEQDKYSLEPVVDPMEKDQ